LDPEVIALWKSQTTEKGAREYDHRSGNYNTPNQRPGLASGLFYFLTAVRLKP
jgi:hypothetical protein